MNEILALPSLPTALFVASDVVCMGALQAIRRAGLRIPEDLSVVGFDDISLAAYYEPPLTTVRLPAYQLGWTAGDRLTGLIENREVRCWCAVRNRAHFARIDPRAGK